MSTEPPSEALEANAYAISYRLLGDRPAARAAALVAVERVRARGELTGPRWLADLAAETVTQSVGPITHARRAPSGPSAEPVDGEEGLRVALRRRLESTSRDEQTAAALHHLAGYPIDDVAAAMGRSPDDVARLTGALARPPGVSYRLLGDPELLGPAPPRPSRRLHGWRPALHWTTVVVTVAVVALVVAAGMSVGARPTLGPVEPGRSAVRIGPSVPVQRSQGCSVPAQPFGTFRGTVRDNAVTRSYRLAVPAPSAPRTGPPDAAGNQAEARPPRGLIVALPDYGQSAEQFAAASDLERMALARGYLVATVDPIAPRRELNVTQDPARPDDTLHTLAVVEDVLSRACIDRRRVNLVGAGPGAQLAGALACIRPDRFATASSVGGGFLPRPCRLDPPVSYLQVWNADDDVLAVAGGYGPGLARVAEPSGGSRPPADPAAVVFDNWANLLGTGAPATATEPNGSVSIDRTGGVGGSAARSVTNLSGGATWPSGASAQILDFARAHARAT